MPRVACSKHSRLLSTGLAAERDLTTGGKRRRFTQVREERRSAPLVTPVSHPAGAHHQPRGSAPVARSPRASRLLLDRGARVLKALRPRVVTLVRHRVPL